MQFETVLTAKVPRVKYADGRTELVAVPWAQPHGRFTLLFEAWAIQVLFACHSVSAACELLGLNWETAQTIMDRAVERGLARRDLTGLARLGIDEKSFGRGQDYIAVLSDVDQGCVLEVVPGRDQASAELLLETVPEEQRVEIEAVAMDMSGAFAAAVQAQLPGADIVYDRFHVSALLNQAVDEVRRAEHKRLLGEGDESLKGTRQLWLFNPRNLEDERLENLARLAACNFKTSRAWLQKENFNSLPPARPDSNPTEIREEGKFPVDAPQERVMRALQALGFEIVRRGNHLSLARTEPDGSVTPMTLPGHRTLKSSTLRTALNQSGIARDDFIRAYEQA